MSGPKIRELRRRLIGLAALDLADPAAPWTVVRKHPSWP